MGKSEHSFYVGGGCRKLIKLQEFQADFKKGEDACVNVCRFN